ncbi:MAG: zinc-binding dehydrogenase [Lachnospiraceae bacterium]|nr:zinc-binding dehydrogenase [Lachnospiraceae bacterium]
MRAAYLKAKNQFEMRDVELREPNADEVVVRVKACGFCGHDKILASYAAEDWQPFGHEFSGIVEKAGALVTNVKVGDRVAIETSTFNPLSEQALNGRPDWDTKGTDYMQIAHTAMGFSERTLVPAVLCVKIGDLPDQEACFLEPMGVAADLILTADIHLNDDVLLMGCGAIGLMALQMAKASGARHIYVAEHRANKRKIELAKQFGADDIILTDEMELTDYAFLRGGVDRVLVTTPPKTIGDAVKVANVGAVIAFLGISYGPAAIVSFDSNIVHLNKLQIRGSNAIPALYFPRCIDLMTAGIVDVKPLITHTFPLDKTPEGIMEFLTDKENAVKAVMLAE